MAPHAVKRARASFLPWELAGSYASLLGELMLGEAATRASNEPLPHELIDVLVNGSPLHDAQNSLVGMVHLLEYGESSAELGEKATPDEALQAQDTPLSRVFEWASELCITPEMILHQDGALHAWADGGVELIIADGVAPISSVRPSLAALAEWRLTLGMLHSIEEQYVLLAPSSKRVLVAPGRRRTQAIIELLQTSVRVHDACKAILRQCARVASTGVLASAHPIAMLRCLEGVVRHPLFMQWPKRFNEQLQVKLRCLRGGLGVILKLRAHAERMVSAVTQANRALDEHFGEPLAQLRAHLLSSDGTDDPEAEVGRRASLNRLAFMAQQMLLQVQAHFARESAEGAKLHKHAEAHLVPLEISTELQRAVVDVPPFDRSGADSFGACFAEILACVASARGVCNEAHEQVEQMQREAAVIPQPLMGRPKSASSSSFDSPGSSRALWMSGRRGSEWGNGSDRSGGSTGQRPAHGHTAGGFHGGGGHSGKGSLTHEMVQASAQLLELMRTELKPHFELLAEEVPGAAAEPMTCLPANRRACQQVSELAWHAATPRFSSTR